MFLVILVIGLFIAKAIAKALCALLEKAGFDRAVERGGIKTALAKSKFDASDIVAKIIYYTLMLFVLQLAFGVFGPNPISDLLTQVITFLPSLVVAIIIVVVAAAIAAAVKTLVEGALGGLSYGKTLANIASAFVLFLGVVAALNQVGVATTVTTPHPDHHPRHHRRRHRGRCRWRADQAHAEPVGGLPEQGGGRGPSHSRTGRPVAQREGAGSPGRPSRRSRTRERTRKRRPPPTATAVYDERPGRF